MSNQDRVFEHIAELSEADWEDVMREKRAKPEDFEVCNQCAAHIGPEARDMYTHKKQQHPPPPFISALPTQGAHEVELLEDTCLDS